MEQLDYLLKRFELCKKQKVVNLSLYAALKKEIALYKKALNGKDIKL